MIEKRFIILEGLDFCGKTTVAKNLTKHLTYYNIPYVHTREPGGSVVSEKLRTLVLDSNNTISAISELLIFTAARVEHLISTVIPALKEGKVVICERFLPSSFVYQGVAVGKDLIQKSYLDYVHPLNKTYNFSSQMHTVLLDIPYGTAHTRFLQSNREQDRMDCLNEAEFVARRYMYYEALTELAYLCSTFSVIDASLDIDSVCLKVINQTLV